MHAQPPPSSAPDRAGSDRGVSEVIAFVLSFSMVLLSVSILYTVGFSALGDLQGERQTENAESVFLSIADGFSELQEGQAPKRAGSLDLDVGATIDVENESQFEVAVNGPDFSRTVVTRSLRYRLDRTTIAYENGAIFRSDRGESVMLGRPPEIYCSNASRVAVVSIVRLTAAGNTSVGAGTATVTGVQQSTTLLYPDSRTPGSVTNLTVNVTSPYSEAWNRHFAASDTDWVDSDDDGTFACEGIDRAFVRRTVVAVRVIG